MAEYEHYRKFWRNKIRNRSTALLEQKEEYIRLAKECAHHLTENYKVSKVILVGSLVKKHSTFHEGSDIDIVVVDLTPKDYFRALAELVELLPSGTMLNLIPYENTNERMKQVTDESGEILYEK